MGTFRTGAAFLAFVIFLNTAHSLPTPPQTGCPVLTCSGEDNLFAFKPQHTYVYKLEASSENVLSGATNAPGKLHLTATAELQAVSPCQFGLSISQVQVVGSDGKKHQSLSALEGKPVQIGLQDGRLAPELCADEADDINTLNLKRAVASLIQVVSSSQQQTDVFGDCPVEVTVSKGGEGITMFNSQRDLNRCQRRENIVSDIPVSSYLLNSDTQAAPLLSATAKTQQRVKGGVLEAATSHEEYIYRPFSNQGAGAIVSVHTSLNLQSEKPSINFKAPTSSLVHSVVFEPPHSSGTDQSNAETVVKALKAALQAMPHETSANAGSMVQQLVRLMRHTTKDDLLTVYKAAKSGAGFKETKSSSRKVFLDALLHTGTGEAVEVIAELIKNRELEEPTLFYTRLAFTRHATLASLRAVTALLEQGTPPRELVLGAGSLAGHYFEQHRQQPEKEIDQLLARIARPFNNNCQPKGHDQENKVLTAMKGLHNAHYIPDAVADKLKDCAANKKASTRVRSAALDAMQGDAGNKKLKQTAYDILGDLDEDSELRIKAYLVLVTCPCGQVATFVKDLLDKEPVNQVGSFIASHLRNVRASSNPEKAEARKHLGSIRTPANKFSLDTRKFSSNAELSYSLGQANAAASGEANVIFSQSSFLPRFSSFNLTTNLFGHSFNLFEIGLRAENLEHILESYFGPKGYFKTHTPNEMFESSKVNANKLADRIKSRATKAFRGRRSVARADLDKMAAKVQMHDDHDNVNLDLYLKMFGAELAFLTYYGDPSTLNPSALVDQAFDAVDKAINEAKKFDYMLKQHMVLFDTELVYPTATGFPLRLVASSTAALHLHLEGNFDIQAISKDPKNANMRLNVMPSAAIDLSSEMQLDFFAASAGLKHAATLHTSTGVDVTFKVLNGKGFDLNVGTPLAKQEIITAKSELFATSKDRGQIPKDTALVFTIPRRDNHGCFDQLSPLIGLTFCGELGYPYEGVPKKGPLFPLDGPANLVVRVEKEDKSLTSYQLRAEYRDNEADKRSLDITFNTPGTTTDRTVSFTSHVAFKPNYEIQLKLKSPIKNAALTGTLVNNAKEHSLKGKFEMDGDTYMAELGLQVTGDAQTHAEYKPLLTYSGPDSAGGKAGQNYRLDGTITMDRNKEAKQFKYSFDKLLLTAPQGRFQLDGSVSHSPQTYGSDLTFKYDDLKQFVKVKADGGKKAEKSYHAYLEVHTSQYPDFDFAINYDLKHDTGMLDNKLKVHHGTDLKNEINCLTVNQYFKYAGGAEGKDKDFDLTTKNLVTYPALEVMLHFDAEATRKSVHYILEGGMNAKKLSSELSLKFGLPGPDGKLSPRDPGGYELEFKGGAGAKSIKINSGRQVVTADTSKLHFEVQVQPQGSSFKINSDVTHRLQKNDLKLKLTSVLTIDGNPDTYTLCTGIQNNMATSEGHVTVSKNKEDVFLVKGDTVLGDPHSGTFTLLLKGYLEGSGTFTHSKSKNEGNLRADLFSPKLDHRVKVSGDLKTGAKPTSSVATLDILLDADKDPNKKIHFESNIDVAKDGRTFDTKSSLVLISQKFNLAFKGVSPARVPTDAGVLLRFDSQLELPSGQKITSFTDVVQVQPKDGNGVKAVVKLDDGQGAKLNYEGLYSRVVGYAIPTYDVSGKLNLVAPSKKDITLQLSIANREVDSRKAIEYKFDASGSAIPQPLSTTMTVEMLEEPRYHLLTTYGDKMSADLKGTVSYKNDMDKSGEMNMEIKSNIEGYEQITAGCTFKSHREENTLKVTATENLVLNGVRKYGSHVEMDYKREEGHCMGQTELKLFLGPDEKDTRIFTVKHDHKGVNMFRSGLDSPQSTSVTLGLRDGPVDQYGVTVKVERPGDGTRSGVINIEANTPLKEYATMEMKIDHKSLGGGKQLKTNIDYVVNKQRHIHVEGQMDLSEQRRVFGLSVVRVQPASPKPIFKMFTAYSKPSSTELEGEFSLEAGEANPRSIDIKGTAKYPGGLDDFEVSALVNSESLKLKGVNVDISNKPTNKGGRRINVLAKSAEKTYFQGSTNYQRKEEGRTVVYDGQGTFKVGEESRTSEFRLAVQNLKRETDGEIGFDAKLTAQLTGGAGKITLETHNVLSDKTLRAYGKYCGQGDKCSLVEISNSVKSSVISDIHIENKIAIDLHQFTGVPPFRVGGKFHRSSTEFEHKVEAELGKDAEVTRYIYHAFVKNYKGGLHLTLPKRTMAIDVAVTTPENANKPRTDGARFYKVELTAALDQVRQPDQKLTIVSTMEINPKNKEGATYNSEFKFSHPVLAAKDLIVKSRATYGTGQVMLDYFLLLDVFQKKPQAITITLKNERITVNGGFNMTSVLTANSKGQNLDFKMVSHALATKSEIGFGSVATIKDPKLKTSESGILFYATLDNMLLLLRAPTVELVRLEGECKRTKTEETKAKFVLTVLQTLALEGEHVGYKSFKYQSYDMNKKNERFVYSGLLEMDKQLLLSGEQVTGGNAAKLFHLRVALDTAHFLQVDQNVNTDNLKAAYDKMQNSGKNAGDRLTALMAETSKDATTRTKAFLESLKKSQYNFKPLVNRLKEQYAALQEELKTDASVQELVDLVKNLISGFAQGVSKLLETFTVQLDKISATLQEAVGKMTEFSSKLMVVVTEFTAKISKAFGTVFTTIFEIFSKLTARVIDIIKENSEELQKFFKLVADFVKEQNKQLGELLKRTRHDVEEFIKITIEQIKTMPMVTNFKERAKEFYDNFLARFEGVFMEIAETLKEILPTPELKEFVDTVVSYIERKMKNEPVDEIAELEKIFQQMVKAVQALLKIAGSAAPPGLQGFNLENLLQLAATPISLEALTSLPKFFNVRLSFFELLSSEDLPSAADLLATYSVPRHLDDVLLPHRAFGQISASQHFFTFDGDHYTLKGDCQYLLAHDFDDGNFSLAVDLAGGKMRSISLVDRQDNVELKADRTVLLNGQSVELPLHHNELAIFRTLHRVHIKSRAGVSVSCDLHHDLCSFAVNGYYFGKTRGLLGTISNEKYDDLALPNGKIATTVQQFANAYKLSESCVNQAPVPHKHTNHKDCTYAFSSQTSLSACFRFVDATPYRQACDDDLDHSKTKEDTLKAICDASAAYVAKCRDTTFLHPSLPASCAFCAMGGKQTSVGSSVAVKAPQGKADVVIMVEQVAENEEAYTNFLTPLLAALTADLKDKGVADARYAMIGYGGPGQKWPSLFTNNGKFAYDGASRPPQLTFGAKAASTPKEETHPMLKFLDRVRDFAALEFGQTGLGQAFQQVLQYPFRADASKAVFLLRHSPCHKSPLLVSLQQLQMLQAREYFSDRGIVVTFLQPVAITAAGDKKLIGFDADNALTFSKKPVDAALRSEIDYSSDTCASFIDLVRPTVFSMKTFKELKGGQRKQFVSSASSRLASLLSGSEATQSCECRLHEGLHAMERCSVTATKETKADQKKGVRA